MVIIWLMMVNNNIWLVVLTILKHISQWEGLSNILWENKKCLKPQTSYGFSNGSFLTFWI